MPGPSVRFTSATGAVIRERNLHYSQNVTFHLGNSGITDNHHFPLPEYIAYMSAGIIQGSKQFLYHYTTKAGFLSILNSECIWATAYDCLNDPEELVFAKRMLKGEVSKICQSQPGLTIIFSEIDLLSFGDVFISSFSRSGDLGSQWQLYAKKDGVSLGFPREIFEAAALSHPVITVAEVLYEPSQQVKL